MRKYINNDTVMQANDFGFNTWVPTIEEERYGGIRESNLQTKHFTNRKLFLNGEVNDKMANQFVSEFLYLSQSNEPIDIYINSPGGSVISGLVIYDIIQSCEDRIPINIYCVGMAASMGAVILAGGQKGRRFILPHSKCMIHEPLMTGGGAGSATSIQKTAESIMETKAIINGILSKHTGKSIEEINEMTSFDNYMNAEDSVAFGLCDEVRNIF